MIGTAVLLVTMLIMLVPGEGFTCIASNSCTIGVRGSRNQTPLLGRSRLRQQVFRCLMRLGLCC